MSAAMETDLAAAIAAAVVAAVILTVGLGLLWRKRRAASTLTEKTTEPRGLGDRFFTGLTRTRAALAEGLARAIGTDDDFARFEALEEALIAADVGVRTAMDVVESLRHAGSGLTEADVRTRLREVLLGCLGEPVPLAEGPRPLVVLVVGVNGSGKTTTIGKLAHRYKQAGRSVVLGAGDTFRAGAIEQLQVWGERVGVPVVAQQEGADPAAVLYDAIEVGKARGIDVVICDTAGRLQAHSGLMDELGKVVRVMNKALPGCPHEVLLVLDATIGQNALSQARVFKEVVGATGVVLTKLDGTARGGVVVAVTKEMGIPVKLVGLGEGMEDLRDFDPVAFVDALVGPVSESTDETAAAASA
jgi:fused signal recognition particle receptor